MSEIIGLAVLAIGIAILVGLLFSIPIMIIWNVIMPDIFGLPEITFWQAVLLSILAKLIFPLSLSSNKSK